ncbi:MAG TPA: presqualene diphosphate synthase HpnD [Elusimicrobiota bacterium]|nr:presqualene diphosphate synthase HpnD [Elusimicrobiota bacterium]
MSAPAEAPAAERGSNFYLGFLFLPKRKREALAAVYAFCRLVDDIVDSPSLPKEEAARQLEFWRAEIERVYSGEPTHALGRRLQPFVREFMLPKEGFVELIRGMEMDLNKSRYETFADLEKYLFGAAGAVGLLCVEIFGYKKTSPQDVRKYAIAMGNAFQLTNILRDVGADLEMGRIYLPLEDIREAGYSVEALLRREHNAWFQRLMGKEAARAREFYRRARNLLDPADRPAMLPAEVMASIYEAVLDEIQERQFHVLFHRVRLSTWRKASLAFGAFLRSHGIY